MKHVAIEQVISRTEFAQLDSDFTYFLSLLLASEPIAKTISLGMVSAISDEKDRNRYRLEHQLVRPSRRDDITLGLAKKLENFIGNISRRVDAGESFDDFSPLVEMICRSYNPGWLIVARWHMEQRTQASYELAKEELRRFLENDPQSTTAAEAWRLLGHACHQTRDTLGEIHAFIERAQLSGVSFYDLSNTANRFNSLLRESDINIDREQKRDLAVKVLQVLSKRIEEAQANDLSRMAWLAIHSDQESLAIDYVKRGLKIEPENSHIVRLAQRFGLDQ